MRESIGGAWLFGLIITFILLFTGFLCVAVNYNKAFKVKNEVIDFIEREEGLTYGTGVNSTGGGSLGLIGMYLQQIGYTAMGKCPVGSKGIKTIPGEGSAVMDTISDSNKNNKYYYCVTKESGFDSTNKYTSYYKVKLFFKFELPVFGDLTTFGIDGETTKIIYPGDCYTWGTC